MSSKLTLVKAEDVRLKRLSTGLRELDRLTGGLVGGAAHLFYGLEPALSRLFNTIVGAAAVSERVLVVTARDYHRGRSLSTFDLAEAVSAFGGDPLDCLGRILVANAYSREQLAALGGWLAAQAPEVGLAAVLHLTDLYEPHRYGELQRFLGGLRGLLARGAALALFTGPASSSQLPRPDGPHFLRHFCATIVRVENAKRGFARLVVEKGPVGTPAVAYARCTGPILADVEGWF
ncbi:MAG: hypothetical protein QXU69_05705 [Thermofilaceae archaeon]